MVFVNRGLFKIIKQNGNCTTRTNVTCTHHQHFVLMALVAAHWVTIKAKRDREMKGREENS